MSLFEECKKLAQHNLRSQYSHVFYLPIEFPIVPDDLRPDDPVFQREIDERILGLLEAYDVKYETLSGDIPTRVKALLERVKASG
jgi:hypothetical protein